MEKWLNVITLNIQHVVPAHDVPRVYVLGALGWEDPEHDSAPNLSVVAAEGVQASNRLKHA